MQALVYQHLRRDCHLRQCFSPVENATGALRSCNRISSRVPNYRHKTFSARASPLCFGSFHSQRRGLALSLSRAPARALSAAPQSRPRRAACLRSNNKRELRGRRRTYEHYLALSSCPDDDAIIGMRIPKFGYTSSDLGLERA
eukprot:4166459-Pleurochrysis_carterae.AAC.1